jgi:hypothetical protein
VHGVVDDPAGTGDPLVAVHASRDDFLRHGAGLIAGAVKG